jgi:esterase
MLLNSKIEGQGYPFVIIHGYMGMSDNWKTLASKFAALGLEVHALDLRNHGKSFHSNEFSYPAMVSDVIAYCEHHQIKTAHFLGHSMGGKVVMNLAATKPELINKLIVADIAPKYYPPHHQTILAALNAIDFSIQPTRAEVDAIISQYITDFGTKQFLLKNLYWAQPGQLDFRFNLAVFNMDPEVIGQEIPVDTLFYGDTLFIKGDKSDYILDSDYENIYKHFPNAIIKTVLNAGHWVHAENAEDFFEFVSEFLK